MVLLTPWWLGVVVSTVKHPVRHALAAGGAAQA